MNTPTILIADIGGTNARFALADSSTQQFTQTQTLQASEFERLTDAINTYLNSQDISDIQGICLAVAGPIKNEAVVFTNSHWQVNCADLRTQYGIEFAQLLNDWEAIAHSLSHLASDDLSEIGGAWENLAKEDYTLGALGPGSGLGTSGLVHRSGHSSPIIAEGGHAGFAPENRLQVEILDYLHRKFDDRVSRERLLSGPGIVNIYEALCEINKQDNAGIGASDIANQAFNHNDQVCQQTLEVFFEILGQVAGDIALTLGAYQGMFIGGGICQRYPEQLARSNFRRAFENKGRYKYLMKDIPTRLITHNNPGLLGASVYAKATLSTAHSS